MPLFCILYFISFILLLMWAQQLFLIFAMGLLLRGGVDLKETRGLFILELTYVLVFEIEVSRGIVSCPLWMTLNLTNNDNRPMGRFK
jgi:hypothetical protein